MCGVYADAYPVYIAGIQLTDENLSTITETMAERNDEAMERFLAGDMDITFDVATTTLTLKNAIIDARGLTAQGMTLGLPDMTVVLEGDNIIYSDYSGIKIARSATIQGSGSIAVDAKENGVFFDPNSNIEHPTFTISDTKLSAKGTKYGAYSAIDPCQLTIFGNTSVVKLKGTEGSVYNTTLMIRARTLKIVGPQGAKVSGSQVVDAGGNLVKDTWVVIEQPIEINQTNFPDENFRNWLLSQAYGTDGLLSSEEIQEVTEIDPWNQGIKDLKGVEFFTELTTLDCDLNQLTSLDVSKNTKLSSLDCSINQLTSLDVSKNTKLSSLDCSHNQLTSLDLSKNTSLEKLGCNNNQLTSLDLSKNTSLQKLVCYSNQIKGEQMQALVESLPSVTSGNFYVIDSAVDYEQNVITKEQVKIATDKGWTVYDYSGGIPKVYAGCADLLTLAFSAATVETTFGQTFDVPTLTFTPDEDAAHKAVLTYGTWSSSDESVAIVDEDGIVGVVGVGTATIKLSFPGDDDFQAAEASFDLTVQKGTPELSFSQETYEVIYGETFEAPVVMIVPAFDVTYSSSDESVATVDAITGEVTLLKAGEVTITATFSDNGFYNTASASYTLKVVEPDAVNGIAAGTAATDVFDVAGRKLDTVGRGINIVRSADGRVRKVLKK